MHTKSFLIQNIDNTLIIKLIEELYPVKKEMSYSLIRTYYDTFNLNLYKKGLTLYKTAANYVLEPLSEQNNSEQITFKSSTRLKFWQDFPTVELNNKFKLLLGIRALVGYTKLNNDIQQYNIVDSEDKIVARFSFEKISLHTSDSFIGTIIRIKPVKGYYKYSSKLIDLFTKHQNIKALDEKDFIKLLVKSGGILPIKYNSKPISVNKPKIPSNEALKKILYSLIGVIKINKDGLIKDIDTEFLHDFRVAIRRTRSILSLLKNVFNDKAILPYKLEFASIAGATNSLRDYDVYLLNKDIYQQILPTHLHQGLHQFFINIKRKKMYEHRKITKLLDSPAYHKHISSWEDVLKNGSDDYIFNTANSTTPIIDLACENI